MLGSDFVFGGCGNLTSETYLSTGEWMGGGGTGWEGMGWEEGWLLGSGFVFGGCGNLTSENYLSTDEWMGRLFLLVRVRLGLLTWLLQFVDLGGPVC